MMEIVELRLILFLVLTLKPLRDLYGALFTGIKIIFPSVPLISKKIYISEFTKYCMFLVLVRSFSKNLLIKIFFRQKEEELISMVHLFQNKLKGNTVVKILQEWLWKRMVALAPPILIGPEKRPQINL